MFKGRRKKYFLVIKRTFWSLSLILIFLGIIFYFGKSKIERIHCQINKTPCSEKIEKEFEEFLGQNFFLANPKTKIRELKVSAPHWEKIEVKKIPFNKILVEITTRQPIACLIVGEKTFLLDEEGVVVKESDLNPGLPEIEAEKFNKEEVKTAIEAIILLSQYSLTFKRIKIMNQGNLVLFLPETEVFLPKKELPSKIASLQMILNRAKIEGKLPKKIDLRFKKPVITY